MNKLIFLPVIAVDTSIATTMELEYNSVPNFSRAQGRENPRAQGRGMGAQGPINIRECTTIPSPSSSGGKVYNQSLNTASANLTLIRAPEGIRAAHEAIMTTPRTYAFALTGGYSPTRGLFNIRLAHNYLPTPA
jgi:hypothetical protein